MYVMYNMNHIHYLLNYLKNEKLFTFETERCIIFYDSQNYK